MENARYSLTRSFTNESRLNQKKAKQPLMINKKQININVQQRKTQQQKDKTIFLNFDYHKLAQVELAKQIKNKIKNQQRHIKRHVQRKKKQNIIRSSMNKMVKYSGQYYMAMLQGTSQQKIIQNQKSKIINSYKNFTFDSDALLRKNISNLDNYLYR